MCKQDVPTPHSTEAITADVPAALPGQPTGITTPDRVLPHYPAGHGDKQTLSARLGNWSGCITCVVLVAAFGLALTVLVLPACQTIREAERRTYTMNNMKQIGLACHSFYDTYKTLPTPMMVVGKDGKTVELSWRVSIMPFLEAAPQVAQIDRSSGWDSPANRPLAQSMPSQYDDAMRDAPDAPSPATYFQYFTGPNTLWPANAPVEFKDIIDGTSHTILFAEGAAAVPWTKPADMVVAPNQPLPLPADARGDGGFYFLACLADGSVRTINAPEATIHLLIDPRDGQIVPDF